MSNSTSFQNPLADKIEFISSHKPNLQPGTYKIEIQQNIKTKNGLFSEKTYQKTTKIAVYGERFSLNPQEIKSVFPPAASLGEYSKALPSIVIHRSTLPWERSAIEGNSELPWLVLLLFDEDEAKDIESQSIKLADLKETPTNQFPTFEYETSQHPDDIVTVIDVKKDLLQAIMPSVEDLKLMAHVRQAKDGNHNPIGDEFAVIIGNRLPKPGKHNTVHLVSVENRYTNSGFNYDGMGDKIRLVTLKSWQFTCANDEETFDGLLKNLKTTPSTLRLPINSKADAEKYLSQGFIPLNYQLQQGTQTVSWYRSPLITGSNSHKIDLPVKSSNELLQTNPHNSLVDVSYAAAWELGRLLTLQRKKISVALSNWKATHRRELAKQ